MSPRKYQMTSRAESVAATRAAIVTAAMTLHAERGVQATSWDDIATTAGVSTATVYRQFPSLTELIPECARTVFDLIKPPTLEEAAPRFAQITDHADRFEHLVRATVHCYRPGQQWLHAAYRERDFIADLDVALRLIEDSLRVLIRAAAGRRLDKQTEATMFVLCNFPLYKQLIDSGLSHQSVEQLMVRLVRDQVAHRLPLG